VDNETPEIRVLLDEKDFRGLVTGAIVDVDDIDFRGVKINVKIALSDIGWDRMALALRDAADGNAVDGPGDTRTEATDPVGETQGRAVASEDEVQDRKAEDAE
jgi:hypothetical protein